MNSYELVCSECNKGFNSKKKNQKTCSIECRKLRYIKLYGGKGSFDNLSTGTVGALSELMVSSDLLKKGYAVFRALSPSCFCDLIAIKNKRIIRIEVRTAYMSMKRKVNFPNIKHGEIDCFGLYVPSHNLIEYRDKNGKNMLKI